MWVNVLVSDWAGVLGGTAGLWNSGTVEQRHSGPQLGARSGEITDNTRGEVNRSITRVTSNEHGPRC